MALNERAGASSGPPRDASPFELSALDRGTVRLEVEVATLGHTFAPNTAGRIGDPRSADPFTVDARGECFYGEALVYPAGTIPRPSRPAPLAVFPGAPPRLHNEVVWNFASPPAGHWLARGWVLINGRDYPGDGPSPVEAARTEPHLLSEQTFVLGRFGSGNLSPETIVTSGVENGNDPDREEIVRAVCGGTGRFRHARGEVVQTRIGRNTTLLRSIEHAAVHAPNYRFVFELRLD